MSIKTVAAALVVAGVFAIAGNSSASAQNDTNNGQKQPKIVTVQPSDTLEKIAQENQTNYKRLFNANLQISHPDVIHPNDKVRVPEANEQLADRPIPGAVAAASAPAPKSVNRSTGAVTASDGSVWDRLAQCESGGRWNVNTGNGYSGGLQFSASSWRAAGGTGSPATASREQQIAVAENLKAKQGWGAWPACSAKLGLR